MVLFKIHKGESFTKTDWTTQKVKTYLFGELLRSLIIYNIYCVVVMLKKDFNPPPQKQKQKNSSPKTPQQ